jgi:hypothetical protein
MLPFLIPAALVGLIGGSWWKISKDAKAVETSMSTDQKNVYESALKSLKDPGQLRLLADAFEKQNFVAAAAMLRKRASLRELPAEVKGERRKIFRAAMASKDAPAVRELASRFEGDGATGAAECLRRHADTINAR